MVIESKPENTLMPVLFVGHGNPMNALAQNRYTAGWAAIGRSLPRPRAILCVSAHYYIPFCMVTASAAPPTIHDFAGFPSELYQVGYPAPGSPELARRVKALLAPEPVRLDDHWGLDHGTWSVLGHLFPRADIPVVQLSIDETRPPDFHYEIGRRLMPLRKEGVLIVGSGNLVHNLALYRWHDPEAGPFDWAVRFETRVRACLAAGDSDALIRYEQFGDDARLAVPTPDHYLPFLYTLGLRRRMERVDFPVEGVDGGSVSMLAVRFG
jgi:4,5-DOPA dioxygenase extradiol